MDRVLTLRVLMTADCVGGVWTYAMTLCRALAEHDVHVTLAITGGDMSDEQRAQADALPNADWHHKPFKCEWMQPPLADVAAAGEWLESLWDEVVPDVVHLNDFAHGDRWFGQCPRLVVAHSDVVSWHHAVHERDPDGSWHAYRTAVAEGLSQADAVVIFTQVQTFGLQTFYGYRGRPRIIPNAIDVPLTDAVDAEREPFVLTAGRIWDEAKNASVLAEAAAGLSWPVKVVGDARHPDGGTAATFENVELLGPLPRSDLLSLMRRAGIYAAPARYEPFGLAIAEAAACGCPLVLGALPSLIDLWGASACYFESHDIDDGHERIPCNDPADLQSTLQALIDDPQRRRELSRDARRTARHYTPARQAAAYFDLYQQLAAAGRRPTANKPSASAP